MKKIMKLSRDLVARSMVCNGSEKVPSEFDTSGAKAKPLIRLSRNVLGSFVMLLVGKLVWFESTQGGVGLLFVHSKLLQLVTFFGRESRFSESLKLFSSSF